MRARISPEGGIEGGPEGGIEEGIEDSVKIYIKLIDFYIYYIRHTPSQNEASKR